MPDREAIRSNAKYLRNVRPIDPEEICEYVADQPHPAVVKRVLREEAVDLGLVERDDGTFVPVSEEPVVPPELPVERFPEQYGRALEDLLVEAYGADWHAGESGDGLREALRGLKRAYHRGWDVDYDERAALAYAIYHLPDYYAAVQYVLAELAEVGLLGRELRICDVGAGVGGPALGIHDALASGAESGGSRASEAGLDVADADAAPGPALVQYDAVEPGPPADALERLLEETGRNFHADVHRTTAEAFEGPDAVAAGERDPYDLILFGNVLSELDAPVETASRYLDALAEDGALLLLSPADRHTARTLRIVERALVDGRVPEREDDFWADQLAAATGAAGEADDGTAPEAEDPDVEDANADDSEAEDSGASDSEAEDSGASDPEAEDSGTADDAEPDRATVFSPTVRLWPGEAPTDEGWSFVVRPDLEVPAFQRKLDDAADAGEADAAEPAGSQRPGDGQAGDDSGDAGGDGEFVNVDVQYSYATLRRDGEARIEYRPDRSRYASLAESERHVSDRVDCVAIKLSGDLSEGGNPLFRVGDGSERADHFAVLARETALNDDLRTASYGDLLTLQSVLVLWNEDEAAFNLVVDDETTVDVAPAPLR